MKRIFKVGANKESVIAPPSQVFSNTEFEFLFTIGGGLIANENEYNRFVHLLKTLGEDEFYITENIGATLTERVLPFCTTVNLTDSFAAFKEKFESFNPPFGWLINHFFVWGKSEAWGIYICEYPTINIIGCAKELIKDFKAAFSIEGNGYPTLKTFVEQEYSPYPKLLEAFLNQYKLKV